jgi:polyamine oxidase
VPDPIAFMYPRWSTTPWAYGSFSNWPPGLTLEGHQNLRANVERLWFAGEATNAEFFGYLQGAYLEGKHVGETIAACLTGGCETCSNGKAYSELLGTTALNQYVPENGWFQTSFQTVGDLDLPGGGG